MWTFVTRPRNITKYLCSLIFSEILVIYSNWVSDRFNDCASETADSYPSQKKQAHFKLQKLMLQFNAIILPDV